MTITATFQSIPDKNTIAKNRKENAFYCEYAVHFANVNGLETPIIARFYVTKVNVYACVWVSVDSKTQFNASGGGKAGGYGYHKGSAALEDALNSAGFTLSQSIAGRGESAMLEALRACAVALGYNDDHIFIHHAHA